MAASSTAARARRRTQARGRTRLVLFCTAVGSIVVALGVGFAFAGTPGTLAYGTRIDGVDVGGLSPSSAQSLLEQRAARLADVPVAFSVGTQRFDLTPRELGVSADWASAVSAAARAGGGFDPLRGYRRLELRLFSSDVTAAALSYDGAINYEIGQIAAKVDTAHREARLVRIGLHVSTVRGITGHVLARPAAAAILVRSLASLSRAPVVLPVRTDRPSVTAASLEPARLAANRVLSAPVTLQLGPTHWRLPRYKLAPMLILPTSRRGPISLGGSAADAYFAQLDARVDRDPQDATWAPTTTGGIRLVPAQPGIALDIPRSADRVLAAAERSSGRTAKLVVAAEPAKRSTSAAQAMGITGVVGSYETDYGGEANRIHNVQLVAHLVDDKLIAPGATFSFNGTTGDRSAAKGFLEAPVIINGELQTGLGGGVCQVSTTVFNAAYEAGLRITDRTNHALYISHYPLGRDATVDYPDIDLKFVNDTPHWLLVRTFVGAYSLTVTLYGTPQHRKIVTDAQPLTIISPPPVKRVRDPALPVGTRQVVDYGAPATTTSVRRQVYAPNGALLSDETWPSYYQSQPKIVEIGTHKAKAKAKGKAATKTPTAGDATTTPTATTPTTLPSQSPLPASPGLG